ncbi:MAG: hypothetical protein GYA77_01265 [Candidatus Cloacimonetes bacterium]|jgi:hypothetical protein|nr:hypothetical protein [Candidatus Cloacimonadota bacterium]
MPTLIQNVGILDARKATLEQIREIAKLNNVGCLVVNSTCKADLLKVDMLNVGKMLELDDDYKLHTGPLEISRQMLEDSPAPLKLCVVGPLSIECDVNPELLLQKISGLCLIGPASIPKALHGAFMSAVKDQVGPISTLSCDGGNTLNRVGKLTITNNYLESLDDNSELNLAGSLELMEEVDPQLFTRKIARIKVVGSVECALKHEEMLRKVLVTPQGTEVRIIRADFHYVPGGTQLDTFTIMTFGKKTISCPGLLILDEEFNEVIVREQDIRFEAGTLYFPKTVMKEMAARLSPGSRGIPYEPGKLALVTSEQNMTQVRLETLPDNSLLLVNGILEFDDDIDPEMLTAKIGCLDNYGEITASKDIASILQGKLRRDEGSIVIKGREEPEEEYDHVIQNVATYTL